MNREKLPVILLVEDDPGDQELLRRAFAEVETPCRLVVLDDGDLAMDYLLRRGPYSDLACHPRPDLLLLDLNLPRMKGRDVVREIRAHRDLRLLPIVVLTTSGQKEEIDALYEFGVNSYITKPRSHEGFLEIGRALSQYWFGIVRLPSPV